MRVEILDHHTFGAIDPLSVRRYLAVNGWRQVRDMADEVIVMGKETDGKRGRLLWVPTSRVPTDYEQMIARVVSTVAEVDDKSQLQVVDDLQTVGIGDVIRGATADIMNRHAHTLPLDEGQQLLRRLRQLAVAGANGANNANDRKPVYSHNYTGTVQSFVQNLRLGQTEPGSYLMRLIAPLPETDPSADSGPDGQILLNPTLGPVPFARLAVIELMRSVRSLYMAAHENAEAGRYSFDPYRESIRSGVSANLCEAIVASNETAGETPLSISITWSYVIAGADDLPTRPIHFEAEVMPFIREAGRELRRRNPLTVTVDGWVAKLGRATREVGDGTINLVCRIDGRLRTVRIDLSRDAYQLAHTAHGDGLSIRLTGELIEDGYRLTLRNPRHVSLIQDASFWDLEQTLETPT